VAVTSAPLALLGPGTGLGVSGLIPAGDGWVPLGGEGGHRDLAASSEREWQIVTALAARFGRASAERAISGPGLVWLYETICGLDGRTVEADSPAEVAARASSGDCAAAAEATRQFSAWLGAVAGDLVLTLGARGGLYLGGGVLERLGAAFDRGRFLARFDAKGRFADYLRPVPIRRILSAQATLAGAARALLDPRLNAAPGQGSEAVVPDGR
jgi:glucokinase